MVRFFHPMVQVNGEKGHMHKCICDRKRERLLYMVPSVVPFPFPWFSYRHYIMGPVRIEIHEKRGGSFFQSNNSRGYYMGLDGVQ